ncbi:MAG: hypothetical protein KF681_15585 [Bdellovibrionaceae bacterium]|nr:hypothetical protein [Pseudobdellovibrionaceae bacterium]
MIQARVRTLFFQGLLLCVFLASGPLAGAQESTVPPFQAGIESYQKQDYSAAQTAFEAALKDRPWEASVLTNLALTHYRLGQRGWALGYARRALHFEPGHTEASQLIAAIAQEGKLRDLPHRIEVWELLHHNVLTAASAPAFVALLLLMTVAALWAWLSFFGARRRALASENALPGFPFLPVLFSILFVTSALLALAKWKDASDLRGTVVVERVQALTAPSDQSPSLFELIEGLEVVVRKTEGDWLQVTFPGAMTGWVPKSALLLTQGDLSK